MWMAKKKKKATAPKRPYPKSPWKKRLVDLRHRLGDGTKPLFQREAAERLGVAVSTWIGWENGFRMPRGATVRLINLTFGENFPLSE